MTRIEFPKNRGISLNVTRDDPRSYRLDITDGNHRPIASVREIDELDLENLRDQITRILPEAAVDEPGPDLRTAADFGIVAPF